MDNIYRIRKALRKAFINVFLVCTALAGLIGWVAFSIAIFKMSIIGGMSILFVTAVIGMTSYYYFR